LGTWTSYRDIVDAYLVSRIGGVLLQDLAPSHLDGLYDDLESCSGRSGQPLSPKTVLNVHRALHKALGDAVKRGRVARNVADLVEAPSAPKARTDIWDVEQLRAFVTYVREDRLYPACVRLLFATTGMRRGEVAGLTWGDIDLDRARLRVSMTLGVVESKATWKPRPKSRAGERTMALDPTTVEAMRAHRAAQGQERLLVGPAWESRQTDHLGAYRDGLAFTHADGSLIHPERFSRWFRQICRKAELPAIRLHDVRHT